MNSAHHVPTALESFEGSAYSVQYNTVVPVRREFSCWFEGYCVDKEVGLRAMICVVANIPRIRANRNMRYFFAFKYRVSVALLRHSGYIDPPRVLEENALIIANIISDECSSCTSSWGGKCCKGGFNDVVVGFVDISMPRDRDN